ncbi:hypothetical protein BCR37DRAFT_391901 [Protomyces lactucae-debilis]|uniref:Zn(2)-C6 fungal-type domain-containing protein n=1 Tax=Protomyces lactucae-debilis TaxID=2754530 RepID=A0A1Y2FK37_PROLT|nr:uncharacterized protein BCR37DRAFT_391901 [Protomyces lactucae-debilis]ORY84310.1 hypothetical protein BCR37DRAFT_391901 [Protomyces lactucae-debilis]
MNNGDTQDTNGSEGAALTKRKQWSSCDFCRERKKKCDAKERKELGFENCTRCSDIDNKCTFGYISQKNARRRQMMANKHAAQLSQQAGGGVPTPPGSMQNGQFQQSLHLPQQPQPPVRGYSAGGMPVLQESVYESFRNATGSPESAQSDPNFDYTDFFQSMSEYGSVNDSPSKEHSKWLHRSQSQDSSWSRPDRPVQPPIVHARQDRRFSTSTIIEQDVSPHEQQPQARRPSMHESKATAPPLMEQDINQLLYGNNDFASPVQELMKEASPIETIYSTMVHQRTPTGLSADLELMLIDEFMRFADHQLPILDASMVYMRYRYQFPTPLPEYFVCTVVACGAAYSCKSASGQAPVTTPQAELLYSLAKQTIMAGAIQDNSIDAVCALMLISFHWQGEVTAFERQMITHLSVTKIQALGLHTVEGLEHGRTRRDIAHLKFVVWMNYLLDAFSFFGDEDEQETYLGQEIEIDFLTLEDLSYTGAEYITGVREVLHTQIGSKWVVDFVKAFGTLAKIQNKATRLRTSKGDLLTLLPELDDWQLEWWTAFNLKNVEWHEVEQMANGYVSLNFAYYTLVIFIHIEPIKPFLELTQMTLSSPLPVLPIAALATDPGLQYNVAACVDAALSMCQIFERMMTCGILEHTSQIVREQLYFGGRILQLFYRNHIGGVNLQLLSRWEKCLEIAELVWGSSERGLDLNRMRLEEL